MPAVSITVVAYNSASCIGQALRSIRDEVRAGYAEAILVDNASPDNSVEVARAACPEAVIVRADENRYFAAGCNLSWPRVRGRYWLLLNPDVTVPAGGLRELVDWMDIHPAVGAASPNLSDPHGFPQAPARRFPSIRLALLELSRVHRLVSRERRADLFLGSYYPRGEHLDVDYVVGAAMIIRREAVIDAGLLSEHVPMYGEDSEWSGRIRSAGWHVALAGTRPWTHIFEASTSRTWDQRERAIRTWTGIYASRRLQTSRSYVIVLWLINLLAFGGEAIHPGRPSASKHASRLLLRAHLSLARSTVQRMLDHWPSALGLRGGGLH